MQATSFLNELAVNAFAIKMHSEENIHVVKYTPENKQIWNEFVSDAKNGHFMFHRDYMDYHEHRFTDFSLLIFDRGQRLLAVLPANIHQRTVYSHEGLTFGGLLTTDKMRMETMLSIFDALLVFLRTHEVVKLVYKCIPYIYHIRPAEEDRYALFRNQAKLIRRDVTSTIDQTLPLSYSKSRNWRVNKASRQNLEVGQSRDYESFWKLLTTVLRSRHAVHPVHSVSEIIKLRSHFPDHIKLYTVRENDLLLAGAVVYENQTIAHTQYLANSERGRALGALHFLIDHLIKQVYHDKRYFDFGISTEDAGRSLNLGLIAQKEGFGARPVVHDFYEIDLS